MPDPENNTSGEEGQSTGDSAQEQGGGSNETFDEARARATIEAQRRAEREAKAAAKAAEERAAAAEKRLREIEDAEKSELERAQARVAELEREATEKAARLQETLTKSAVLLAASKQNAIDPDAVVSLIDRAALVIDGETVTNAEQVVKDLLAAKPYLVGQSEGNGNAIPGTPKPGKGATREEQVQKTREELIASGSYRM